MTHQKKDIHLPFIDIFIVVGYDKDNIHRKEE